MSRARGWVLGLAVALVLAWGGCGQSSDPLAGAGGGQAPGQLAESSSLDFLRQRRVLRERMPRVARVVEEGGRYRLAKPGSRPRLRTSAPAIADGALRLESAYSAETWLEIVPEGRRPVAAEPSEHGIVYRDAETDCDAVVVMAPDRLEDLRVLRTASAPHEARYRLRTGADVAEVRLRGKSVEVVDREGRVAILSRPAFAVDARDEVRPLDVELEVGTTEHVLVARLDAAGMEYPIAFDPEWVAGPGWPNEAVVALNSLYLDEDAVIEGDAAVLDEAPGAMLGSAEAHLGPDASVSTWLWANGAYLDSGSEVGTSLDGGLFCNAWSGSGSATSVVTSLTLPVGIPVPAMPAFQGGTGTTSVSSTSLSPGRYGKYVMTGSGGNHALTLNGPGVFEFRELEFTQGSTKRLRCNLGWASPNAGLGCEVRIEQRLIAPNVEFSCQNASGCPGGNSHRLEIFVEGTNSDPEDPSSTPVVDLGGSYIRARIHAPSGTIRLRANASMVGRLVGRDVELGSNAVVEADLGPEGPDCDGYCDLVMTADCSAGPSSHAACVEQCEDDATLGFCQHQQKKWVYCVAEVGSAMHCDGYGKPNMSSCVTPRSQRDTCQDVCGQLDEPDTCEVAECHCTPGSCSTGSSLVYLDAPEGTECSDGNLCNGLEICDESADCDAGTPIDPDDANPCTVDTCDPETGVVSNTPVTDGTSCPNVDLCTTGVCQAGSCVAGPPIHVNEDPCVLDVCDPGTGNVVGTVDAPLGTACPDEYYCNGAETCDGAGDCVSNDAIDPDDGNPCTVDTCDDEEGVLHVPVTSGTSCSDGDACNGDEECNGSGACEVVPSSAPVVDDSIACTIDLCDPLTGSVIHVDTACEPLIDPSVATTPWMASQYLIDEGVQTGVETNAIEVLRAGVLRGRVSTVAGAPLVGVTVKALQQPDVGETVTQGNGWFDFIVNGGGPLTLVFEKDGHPPVQRTLDVHAADYTIVDDVVMTAYDANVTHVYLGEHSAFQVVEGSLVEDDTGARKAVLMFPPGTEAVMHLSASSEPLTTLSVRVTEYTVGERGQEAMPGVLPPSSAYTYAAEVSVDQAVAAGARGVELSQPAIVYLENYYDFPSPALMPVGYYDRERAVWEPELDGIVLKILAIEDGLAVLDLDGDDIAEDDEAFEPLGITVQERAELATRYAAEQTLWRIALSHFSPFDFNLGAIAGGGAPDDDDNPLGNPEGDDDDDDPNCEEGSIIGCENQVLGQRFPVAGTPYALHYQSDRVTGRRAAYNVLINGIGPTRPEGLRQLHYQVDVAGWRFEHVETCEEDPEEDPCQPFSAYEFDQWEGTTPAGILLQGPQPARIGVGYAYDIVRRGIINPNVVGASGGDNEVAPLTLMQASTFAQLGSENLDAVTVELDGQSTTYARAWKRWDHTLGTFNAKPLGLGGLTLSVHHAFSPHDRTLFLGNGKRRSAANVGLVIETVAGKVPHTQGLGNGIPATSAYFKEPLGTAVGPDGSLYVADAGRRCIRRITNGIVNTIAGVCDAAGADDGDEGPATSAKMRFPTSVAVAPDGTVYILDGGSNGNGRVRRVAPDGTIFAFAGAGGTTGFSGDHGPALDAEFNFSCGSDGCGLHLAADGSVYVADGGNDRIRKIATNGTITTVAGGCTGGSPTCAAGGCCSGVQLAATACSSPAPCRRLASKVTLSSPTQVTTGPDGRVYFTDKDSPFVFRLDPDGYLQAIAGTGVAGVTGDGGLATAAKLHQPTQLAVSREGSVYVNVRRVDPLFPTVDRYGIRRITSDGRIDAVVGRQNPACPSETYCGEGGNASAAHLKLVRGLSLSLDGALYLSMPTDNRIVRVRPRMPGAGLEEILIPSEDGRELYVFEPSGRHDRTVDPVLGTTLLEFGYDGGLLETITDRDGRVTTIEHDGNGEPTKIVGPHGHETLLETNGDGYISEIADPLSQAFTLAYDPAASGLLTSLTNPRGHEKTYEYDAFGMLEKANDPPFMGDPLEGGWKSFARTDHGRGQRSVTMTTAGGRTTTYFLGRNPDGGTYRQVVGRDGLLTTTRTDAAGVTVVESPCGLTCQPNGAACTSASQCCSDLCTGGLCGTGSCEPEGAACEDDIECCSDECTGNVCEAVPTCAAGATVLQTVTSPDPRWGMLSPMSSVQAETGGETLTTSTERTVVLDDPNDLLSVETYEEVVTINGRSVTTVVDRTVSPVTRTQTTEAGRQTITELDARGRPTKIEVVNTLGFVPTELSYYSSGAHEGRLWTVKRGTGASERLQELVYGSDGELESIEDALSQTVSFEHDAVGRVTKKIFADLSEVSFAYDAGGNMTKLFQPGAPSSPQDDEIHTFGLNPLNLPVSYTPPELSQPEPTTYLWTLDHQLEQTTQPGEVEIDYVYDARGRVSTVTTPTNVLTYSYNPADHATAPGKLSAIDSQLDAVLLSYEHDGELLMSMTWEDDSDEIFGENGASVSFAYDSDHAVTAETVTVAGTPDAVSYAYLDDDGLMTAAGALTLTRDADTGVLVGAAIGNLVESYGYNTFGELQSYEVVFDDTTPVTKYHLVYDRDALGRVVKKSETVDSQTDVHHYVYDAAGRLQSVYHQQSGTPCDPLSVCDRIAHYTYDDNGNRLAYQPLSGSPVTGTYDAQDRMTSYDGKDYFYLPNGELERTEVGSVVDTYYQYDPMGLLRRVTFMPSEDEIDYVYDGAGRLIGRKTASTERWWLYRDALEPVAELDDEGALVSRFVYGTKAHVPDYMVQGEDVFRFVTDQLGSVRLVVNVSDGTVAQEIDYDAWGRATLISGTWGVQPFGFAGGLYDPDTGLVRFGARDYDATIGRWAAKDPIQFAGDGPNLYAYLLNDPLNAIDPKGTNGCFLACSIITTVVVIPLPAPILGRLALNMFILKPLCLTVCSPLPSTAPSDPSPPSGGAGGAGGSDGAGQDDNRPPLTCPFD